MHEICYEEFGVRGKTLFRWFPKDKVQTQKAKYLDLILYSREQLTKEYFDKPGANFSNSQPDAPWGIISIKPQASSIQVNINLSALYRRKNIENPTFQAGEIHESCEIVKFAG